MVPFNIDLVTSVGAISVVRGLRTFYSGSIQYQEFGLPLESSRPESPASNTSTEGTVSPLIYVKAIREISYGLSLISLHIQRQQIAVNTLVAVGAFISLGDGLVVWKFARTSEQRRMAYFHWLTFVLSVYWYWSRMEK